MSSIAVRRRSGRGKGAGLGLVAWLLGIVFFLPIAWMALTSFHSESDAATNPPSFGAALTLDGYREFFTAKLGHWLPAVQRELDVDAAAGEHAQPQYIDGWVPGTPVDAVPGPLYAFIRAIAI